MLDWARARTTVRAVVSIFFLPGWCIARDIVDRFPLFSFPSHVSGRASFSWCPHHRLCAHHLRRNANLTPGSQAWRSGPWFLAWPRQPNKSAEWPTVGAWCHHDIICSETWCLCDIIYSEAWYRFHHTVAPIWIGRGWCHGRLIQLTKELISCQSWWHCSLPRPLPQGTHPCTCTPAST